MDQGKANESLLDADFGTKDNQFGLSFDDQLEVLAGMFSFGNIPSPKDYKEFYDRFKIITKAYAEDFGAKESIMKACRGKVYTVVAFKESGMMYDPKMKFNNVIEIRKFIKNPRPEAYGIAADTDDSRVYVRGPYPVNHPAAINMRQSEWYILPGDVWDKFEKYK